MIDTYNNSLVEQFAQADERLNSLARWLGRNGVLLPQGQDLDALEDLSTIRAALSVIERHVQDMARWIDTVMAQGGPVTSDYEEGERLLARLGQLGKEPSDG